MISLVVSAFFWIPVCYSSFKPVWNLHLGIYGEVVDGVSNVVLSLLHTVCWAVMKVLIHSVCKALALAWQFGSDCVGMWMSFRPGAMNPRFG